MSAQEINILSVTNSGLKEIQMNFSPSSGSTISITLPAGESFTLIPIPLGPPNTCLRFDVQVCGSLAAPRNCELFYNEVGATNVFYTNVYYAGTVRPSQVDKYPTTIGSSISLSVEYNGDGVVVVGTGDI